MLSKSCSISFAIHLLNYENILTGQFMGNIYIQTFYRLSAKCRVRLDCPNARTDLSLHVFVYARSVQTVSKLPYVGLLELLP